MFVYSVRASSIKFFAVIVLTVAVLVGAITIGNSRAVAASGSVGIKFSGIKTNEDRIEFISQFGAAVSGEPVETVKFSVPENFDKVIAGYNEIQKSQGLNLEKYKNKKVTRYTYRIEKWEDHEGPINVNLIVYRSTVIACDVSSMDPTGFVEPLIKLN